MYEIHLTRKKIIHSLSWQMLNRIFSIIVNFAVQIVLARFIDPEDFGSLAIMTTVVNFAGIFVEAGISTAVIQKKDIDDADIFTVLMISISAAFAAYIILFLAAPVIAGYYRMEQISIPLRVLSTVTLFQSVNSVYTAVYIRNLEFKKLFFRSFIVSPVSGAAGIYLACGGYGVWALVISQLLNCGLTSFLLVFSSGIKLKYDFSLSRAKEIYSFGGKILLTSIIDSFYDTVRTMLIGLRYTKEELAYYDRAYTYSMYVSQFLNMSVSNVLLPLLSRKQDSQTEVRNISGKVSGLAGFCFFPLFMGLAAISESLIICVFGSKWHSLVPFFMVFCFLRMFGAVYNIDVQVFYSLGRSDIVLKYSIGFMILNFITLYFAIPYGVFAIALNRLAAEFVKAVFIMIISARLTGDSFQNKIRDIRKALLNSLIMFLAVFMISKSSIARPLLLMIQVFTGMIIYAALSYLSGDENMKYLIKIVRESTKKKSLRGKK